MASSAASLRPGARPEAAPRALRIRGVGLALVALSVPGLVRLVTAPSETLGGLSAACLLVVALAARWCRRQADRVELERRHEPEVRSHQGFSVQVLVRLQGRRPITGLLLDDEFRIGETPGGSTFAIPALLPGQSLSCVYRGVCRARRGWQKLNRTVLTVEDPLGLVSLTITRAVASELLVLPATQPLSAAGLLNPAARTGADDQNAHEAGPGEEFSGTREWRPGDRSRDIHWRSSARAGQLVVREHARTVRPNLVVVVHLHRPAPWSTATGKPGAPVAAPAGTPRDRRGSEPQGMLSARALDLCVEAAASVVEWGPPAGYRTSLILGALQPEVLESIADRDGVLAALRRLAVAEPQSTAELDSLLSLMLPRIPSGSVIVVCAPVSAFARPEARQALVALNRRGHRVEVLVSYPDKDRWAQWQDPTEELSNAGLSAALLSSAGDLRQILVFDRLGAAAR